MTRANDTVSHANIALWRNAPKSFYYHVKAQLAATKHRLTEGAQLENQQAFRMPPTLAELRHLLLVTSGVLRTYKLWRVGRLALLLPGSCFDPWLGELLVFVSLLQQFLGETNGGHFIYSCLMWGTLAPAVREKVRARLQLSERSPAIPKSRHRPSPSVEKSPASHGLPHPFRPPSFGMQGETPMPP